MRGFLVVFSREIGERRLILLVAAVLSFAPFASPLLLDRHGAAGNEARVAAAVVLAVVFSALLAASLGASIIAGELRDRRLAFYFARPLPGWAIWAGKLGAAFAIALATALLVLLPTALTAGVGDPELLQFLPLWPACLLLLLLVAHALGVIGRARTAWTLLDAVAAVGLTGLAWAVLHQLRLWDPAGFTAERLVPLPGAALVLGLVAASAVQVIGGRTDLRRAHRLLSSTLWGVLLTAALMMTGYVEWYLHPSPASFRRSPVMMADPSGRWVALAGGTSGRGNYYTQFLVDRASGRWMRIRPFDFWHGWHFSSILFAADGRSAAWMERDPAQNRTELVRIDLTRREPMPQHTQVSVGSRFTALSPDGRRIAAVENNRVIITDIASGRLLASTAIGTDTAEVRFVTADRLRVFRPQLAGVPAGTIAIDELDLGTGRLRPLGRIELSVLNEWSASPDSERLMVRERKPGGPSAISLYDVASGRRLAVLPGASDDTVFAHFLPDGRLFAVWRSPRGRDLRLLTRDGVPDPMARPFHFGSGETLQVCGEAAPAEPLVLASIWPPLPAPAATAAEPGARAPEGRVSFRLLRLDMATGTSLVLSRGSAPAHLAPAPLAGTRSPAVLVKTAQGWTWIDAAGRRSPLVPAGR